MTSDQELRHAEPQTLESTPIARRSRPSTASESAMAASAEACAALARAADLSDANPVERLRAWRQAGDAYFTLGTTLDVSSLWRAADAYRSAEAILEEIEVGPVERLHLFAAHGRVLLQLAHGGDLDLAAAATKRLANALSLARRVLPERVADIKIDLCRAEHVIVARRESPVVRDWLDETHA